MQEPHSATICATVATHACNILNPRYHAVGIGLDERPLRMW